MSIESNSPRSDHPSLISTQPKPTNATTAPQAEEFNRGISESEESATAALSDSDDNDQVNRTPAFETIRLNMPKPKPQPWEQPTTGTADANKKPQTDAKPDARPNLPPRRTSSGAATGKMVRFQDEQPPQPPQKPAAEKIKEPEKESPGKADKPGKRDRAQRTDTPVVPRRATSARHSRSVSLGSQGNSSALVLQDDKPSRRTGTAIQPVGSVVFALGEIEKADAAAKNKAGGEKPANIALDKTQTSAYALGALSTFSGVAAARTGIAIFTNAMGDSLGKESKYGATALSSELGFVSVAASVAEIVGTVVEWKGSKDELKAALTTLEVMKEGHDRYLADPRHASREDAMAFLCWEKALETTPKLEDKLVTKTLAMARDSAMQAVGAATNVVRFTANNIPTAAASAVSTGALAAGGVVGVISAPIDMAQGANDIRTHRKAKVILADKLKRANELGKTDDISSSPIYSRVNLLHRERLAHAHKRTGGKLATAKGRVSNGVVGGATSGFTAGLAIAGAAGATIAAGVATAGVAVAVIGGVAGATWAGRLTQQVSQAQTDKNQRREREAAANALLSSVPKDQLREHFEKGTKVQVQGRFLVKYNPVFAAHRKLTEDQIQTIGNTRYLKQEKVKLLETQCDENEYVMLHLMAMDLDPLGATGPAEAHAMWQAAEYLKRSGMDPQQLIAVLQIACTIPLLSERLSCIRDWIAPHMGIALSSQSRIPAVFGDEVSARNARVETQNPEANFRRSVRHLQVENQGVMVESVDSDASSEQSREANDANAPEFTFSQFIQTQDPKPKPEQEFSFIEFLREPENITLPDTMMGELFRIADVAPASNTTGSSTTVSPPSGTTTTSTAHTLSTVTSTSTPVGASTGTTLGMTSSGNRPLPRTARESPLQSPRTRDTGNSPASTSTSSSTSTSTADTTATTATTGTKASTDTASATTAQNSRHRLLRRTTQVSPTSTVTSRSSDQPVPRSLRASVRVSPVDSPTNTPRTTAPQGDAPPDNSVPAIRGRIMSAVHALGISDETLRGKKFVQPLTVVERHFLGQAKYIYAARVPTAVRAQLEQDVEHLIANFDQIQDRLSPIECLATLVVIADASPETLERLRAAQSKASGASTPTQDPQTIAVARPSPKPAAPEPVSLKQSRGRVIAQMSTLKKQVPAKDHAPLWRNFNAVPDNMTASQVTSLLPLRAQFEKLPASEQKKFLDDTAQLWGAYDKDFTLQLSADERMAMALAKMPNTTGTSTLATVSPQAPTTTSTTMTTVLASSARTALPGRLGPQLTFNQLRARINASIDRLVSDSKLPLTEKFNNAPKQLTEKENALISSLLVSYGGMSARFKKQLEEDVARLNGYLKTEKTPTELSVQERVALILGATAKKDPDVLVLKTLTAEEVSQAAAKLVDKTVLSAERSRIDAAIIQMTKLIGVDLRSEKFDGAPERFTPSEHNMLYTLKALYSSNADPVFRTQLESDVKALKTHLKTLAQQSPTFVTQFPLTLEQTVALTLLG